MTATIKKGNALDSSTFTNMYTDKKIDPPVTVTVARQVKPGCELEFERLAAELSQQANRFPGHLGTNLFRPADKDLEYRIIYKFDSMSNFHQPPMSA